MQNKNLKHTQKTANNTDRLTFQGGKWRPAGSDPQRFHVCVKKRFHVIKITLYPNTLDPDCSQPMLFLVSSVILHATMHAIATSHSQSTSRRRIALRLHAIDFRLLAPIWATHLWLLLDASASLGLGCCRRTAYVSGELWASGALHQAPLAWAADLGAGRVPREIFGALHALPPSLS
jgi:hypothetical protein